MRTWLEETGAGKIDPRALDPNTYKYFDPDVLYNNYADSYAFIYYPEENRLQTAPYPDFHGHMLTGNKSSKDAVQQRENAISKGLVLGRFGIFGKVSAAPGVKIIGFWGNPDKEIITNAIKAIVKDFPEYATEPDKIMVAGKRPFPTNLLSTFVPNIQEFAGKESKLQAVEKEDSRCDELGIDVEGQFLTMDKVISNLHMVKGVNLDLMKSSFCANYLRLKKQAQELDCKGTLGLIQDAFARCDCGDIYKQGKAAGEKAYRSELQKTFSNPSRIDTEFRGRQRDIDRAWDYLQKGRNENFSGFREWLEHNTNSQHETQRRRSRRPY